MHGCPYHLDEGLVTGLMAAEEQGDKLSEDDIIANSMLAMSGGQETTSILIGNSVLTLLRHPEQLRKLQADPALIPAAIEELLRFESPIQYTARLAPDDMEIGGQADPQAAGGDGGDRRGEPRPRALPRPGHAWTSTARTTGISPSGGRRTSASARRWRGWRGRSPWRRC